MGRMIDTWHDLYHNGTVVDLINCVHCQEEYIAWDEIHGHGVVITVPDRLEDLEV
jgi:hypothetical protein